MPQDFAETRKLALWLLLAAQVAGTLIQGLEDLDGFEVALTAALLVLLVAWSRAGPIVRGPLAGALLALWWFDLSRAALWPGEIALAPQLVLLRIVAPLGVLLVSFGYGNWLCLAALGALALFMRMHPTDDPRAIAMRANLFFGIGTGHAFVLAYQRTLRTLVSGLTEHEATVSQRLRERARLVEALGDDLTRSIAAMETQLAEERPRAALLGDAHDQLSQALARAQATLDPAIAPPRAGADTLDELRSRMTRWLLWSYAIFTSFAAARIVWSGVGPLLSTCLVLSVYGVGLWCLAKRPAWRNRVVAVVTLLSLAAIIVALFHWGVRTPPPNLIYLPGLAYVGICIGSPLLSFGLFAFCLLMIGGIALAGAGARSSDMQLLLDCALVTSVFQVGWMLMERRVRQMLIALERRTLELSELERFRTRVCGTLFHDVANPSQVLGMLIDLAHDGSIAPEDAVRARRLLTRLSHLVSAALAVLAGTEPRTPPELCPVSITTLFEELEELFGYRLAAKQQTLHLVADPNLVVLAAPELLRDSVLANLVSNAIKFSSPGATIQIGAQRVEGQIEISVRDRGPGFSHELIERLAQGVRPHSTVGSAGETGLGLGLTLASEHVRRMGGRLSLRSVPEGGEAAVWLPRRMTPQRGIVVIPGRADS